MPIPKAVIEKISKDVGINDIEEFQKKSINALLNEEKRKIKMDIFTITDRYKVKSAKKLEEKIKNSLVAEHPAWEDLIVLENLETSCAQIEQDIRNLQ